MATGFVVRARLMSGQGEVVSFPNMSKNAPVKELQAKIAASSLAIPIARQRLIAGGKIMKAKDANGHPYTLHDYQVQHESMVMVMEIPSAPLQEANAQGKADESAAPEAEEVMEEREPGEELPREREGGGEEEANMEVDPEKETSGGEEAKSGEEGKEKEDKDAVEFVETADGEKIAVPKDDPDAPPQIWCTKCKDDPDKRCLACSCKICKTKEEGEDPLICDECQDSYHLACLDLSEIPDDDWFCPECRRDGDEIVGAGADLKGSRKRKRGVTTTKRDWGKGMATASVEKRTDIGKDHLGAIPDVDVGQTWVFRADCASSGVHRPPVSGMHSKGTVCFSIVASHGYEDDADQGDEIWYTGEGGRDLSGNKRTNEQSKDQEWIKANLALAHSCAARFNPEGGDAGDKWRKGRPVRLVRGNKNKKASQKQAKLAAANKARLFGKAAPPDFQPAIPDLPGVKQIFRYDGVYKVVKYWREKGTAGFLVCRFLLRRDDDTPAPWTEEGRELIKSKGLSLKLPDGSYHCTGSYQLSETTKALIEADELNAERWREALETLSQGKTKFVEAVKEKFACDYCQDPMRRPVSMGCEGGHLLCADCVKRSFKANRSNPELKAEERGVRCEYCKPNSPFLELQGESIRPEIYTPLAKALAVIIGSSSAPVTVDLE